MDIQNQDTVKNLLRKLAYPSKMDKKTYLNLMSRANSLLQKSSPDENNTGIEGAQEGLDHLIRSNSYTKATRRNIQA